MDNETGVKIEGYLYFSTVVYGVIEEAFRTGDKEKARQLGFEIVVDALNCEDTSNVQIISVDVNLNT